MRLTRLGAALLAATAFSGAAQAAKWSDCGVNLITIDPGHFHAALVQKFDLADVNQQVQVFAPPGEDLDLHLRRIESFNKRPDRPTKWQQSTYTKADWLEKALEINECMTVQANLGQIPTVAVLSGNNARKMEYITRAVGAGINVLADKPMVIRPEDFPALQAAFATARKRGVLLYDIMTERFEITTILQRELSRHEALFGALDRGSPENPAITKISVHNFSKVVAGAQLKRPQWFFDPGQQGAGIVDVTTHLVDLVQWEAFPEVVLKPGDAKVLSARRWDTPITRDQFARVTGAGDFPDYLAKYVKDGVLHAPANGEFTYTLRGIHAKVSVTWDYEAPPGAGDTHFSVMRGTRATLTIKQGKEQGFKPVLYVERAPSVTADRFVPALQAAVQAVARSYPGIAVTEAGGQYVVAVPDHYHNGHEAHFTQVTEKFLRYLREGKMPKWEVPNMITKYATIMQAYEHSRERHP
jgi:predicted dehydrogenase